MATKPPFLKYILEILINLIITNQNENVKKFKPLVYAIFSAILIVLLWIFDPSILEGILKFLLNLF